MTETGTPIHTMRYERALSCCLTTLPDLLTDTGKILYNMKINPAMTGRDLKKLEKLLVSKKDWKYAGEVKASERPTNSLVGLDVEFDTAVFNVPVTKDQNAEILRYVIQRFREKTFDNHVFKEVKKQLEVEVYDVEPCETNKEILALYERIEAELKKITDYGNDGFYD